MGVSFILFCCCLALTLPVHGQDQSGFISIDCGIPPQGSNYTDKTTGIRYTSDAGFVDTGESKAISSAVRNNYTLEQQLFNVRSFPKGARNCYGLRPEGGRGNKYLIRASFLYGNYDGFISIACGIPPEDSNYIDKTTGIRYTSDAGFVDTGESKTISSAVWDKDVMEQQYYTLRSFPQGTRNCYTLRPARGKGNKYLIRALFLYGNYDGKDQPPQFDLHIGVDFWYTVTMDKDPSITDREEIIHVPNADYINVCLVNTGHGTPFISALELRPLDNSLYETENNVSLDFWWRRDLGSTTNDYIRYEDDVYDRVWRPYNWEYPTINTSFTVDPGNSPYKIPSKVMSTAITPTAGNDSLEFWFNPSIDGQFYFYLHFAEVQVLLENQSREFNIYLNGYLWNKEPVVVPNYLSTTTLFDKVDIKSDSSFEISIKKTSYSTHPPILNAIELYNVKQLIHLQTDEKDAIAIMNIKAMYEVRKNWQGDPCTSEADNWFGIICSYDGVNPPRIIYLNLSSDGLTGVIAPYIANLTMLQSLDLSNNNLTGQVPDFLSQLTSLKFLYLKGNNFTGSIPTQLIAMKKDKSLFLSIDGVEDENTKKKNKVVPIVASVASLSLFLTAIMVIMWIIKWRKQGRNQRGRPALEMKNGPLTYSEVLAVTNNFQTVIGKGGFGTVYHGYLGETQVAVKMLSPSSIQGYKEFQAEANLLMSVRHTNLTSLMGYCDDGTNMGIVYEYMANGNLNRHLFDRDSNVLSWEMRLRVATDAAQGLEYLHHGCKPPIIHRDVKTTNILLNEKFQAKLADFGLCRVLPADDDCTYVSTTIAGTHGYLDPEYFESNRLTTKSDVYSFGVVLLEIITGRPPIQEDGNKTSIIQWVRFMLANGDIRSIVDPRILLVDFDVNSAWKVVELAMACVSHNSTRRPAMYNVVMELRECLATETARQQTEPKESIGGVMPLYLESLPEAR